MKIKEKVNSVPGKIILSGEYAVVLGKRGIAVPSKEKLEVRYEKNDKSMVIEFVETPQWGVSTPRNDWIEYAETIAKHLGVTKGLFIVYSDLPLGKGMGSSTALVVAICRAILGPDCKEEAREIEDKVNSGHSGLDFAVIWNEKPTLFQKGKGPEFIELPKNILEGARLIDTGTPNERTPELIAWVKSNLVAESHDSQLQKAIETIGNCTERLIKGESLKTVMRDHHRAQVALGVVPPTAQKVIEEIERGGGAAKVIGAGGRTGGGGMVLVIA